MHRRQAIQTLAAGAALSPALLAAAAPVASLREATLARGLAWLLAQQAADGGWHSETYGALKQGAALTALAIYALAHVEPEFEQSKIDGALAKGLKFLEPGFAKRGFLAGPDGSLDYPTYGTAMLATAAQLRDFGLKPELRDKFVAWVVGGQLHESREFTEKSPHYGGWDLMGASQVKGLTSDTTVSCTCFALEAIYPSKEAEVAPTLARARAWTRRCQTPGGGFQFSPDAMSLNNKAGWTDEAQNEPKPYSSATADGLRCLRYSQPTDQPVAEDQDIASAETYLEQHPAVDHVPGFEHPEDANSWAQGLRYYYYQSLAKALPEKTPWALARRAALVKQLAQLQHKDGHWQNESARMREDDPLIASCLALVGLARC